MFGSNAGRVVRRKYVDYTVPSTSPQTSIAERRR